MEDSIFRCLIEIRCQRISAKQVLQAIPDGEFYLIVLEWGDDNGKLTPRQFVKIAREDIRFAPADCNSHELISLVGIDLDHAAFTDLPAPLRRTFQPPPTEDF